MHTSAHPHPHHCGTKFSLANVAVTVLVMLLFLILLFLFLTLVAGTAQAQNSVPPSARQAATMTQFASRLAHPTPAQAASRAGYPAPPRASYKNSLDPLTRVQRGGPLDANEIYDNGPINGTTDAWTLNFGFVISNSFTAPNGGSSDTVMTFGAWLFPGDVLQTVEVSITSAEFGGTIYLDQVLNFTQSGCSGNQYGFNICTETSSNFSTVNLIPGSYWVNLSNAVVNSGNPVYWDENSGAGCGGQGCPSSASENSVGTIPSEAFTLEGTATGPDCVHDDGFNGAIFQIIHRFTSSEGSPAPGLAIDQENRLFGTSGGGNNGVGLAYKVAPSGENWIFTPLYSFLGGLFGQGPSPETIGPEKALYGIAGGGLQQCGALGDRYCGVVYRLRPLPYACLTALCGWGEEVIYSFTGNASGWSPNGNLAFDSAGNLYGTTSNGGLSGLGTVYELTPSGGGWTEKVIYSFTSGDVGPPASLLLGRDGNLYGTTGTSYLFNGGGPGVIFRLTPSGGNWIEQVLGSFGGCGPFNGSCSFRLLQQHSGAFYGVSQYTAQVCDPYPCYWGIFGQIFQMSSSGQFAILDDSAGRLGGCCAGSDVFDAVVVDAAGNVYATEDHNNFVEINESGVVFKLVNGQQEGLAGFNWYDFSGRDLEVDANGKLYGTTGACGSSPGTVWQLTP